MSFVLNPRQLYIGILSGWINRQQQGGDRLPAHGEPGTKEKLGGKRILLNDEQRRRLAVKSKILGRKRLREVGTVFTPDTILRWHRFLIAKKWDFSHQRE